MEWVLTILIFIGMIAVTAVIFAVWLIVMLARSLFRAIAALFTTWSLPSMPADMGSKQCVNPSCRAPNPSMARYCRRCGTAIGAQPHAMRRRVATW